MQSCRIMLSVVLKLVKICWFQVLGLIRGWWQLRGHGSKLLWCFEILSCFKILHKSTWGFGDFVIFGGTSLV
jgi:hypothetical protein